MFPWNGWWGAQDSRNQDSSPDNSLKLRNQLISGFKGVPGLGNLEFLCPERRPPKGKERNSEN